MGARRNEEFHCYLDALAESRFFGELTLYFQDGVVESGHKKERVPKEAARSSMQAMAWQGKTADTGEKADKGER